MHPFALFCSLYWSSSPLPPDSFFPFMVLPCIRRRHEWNAQLLIAGTQMHRARGAPHIAERGGGGREDTTPKKVGDRKLSCATTVWLNWVMCTGSNCQMLNTPPPPNPHGKPLAVGNQVIGVQGWGKGWLYYYYHYYYLYYSGLDAYEMKHFTRMKCHFLKTWFWTDDMSQKSDVMHHVCLGSVIKHS